MDNAETLKRPIRGNGAALDTETASAVSWQVDGAGVTFSTPDPEGRFYLISPEPQGNLYRVFFAVDGVIQLVDVEATLDDAKGLAERHRGGDPAAVN